MTSTYHFPIDLNQDTQQHHHLLSSSKTAELDASSSSSSSSSFSYPIFNISPSQPQSGYYHQQQAVNVYASHGGSWDHQTIKIENGTGIKLSVCKNQDTNIEDQRGNSSVKWMSSKMRLMRKMMTSNQALTTTTTTAPDNSIHKFEDQKDDNNTKNLPNSTNSIRVCADCNTTKTPLWRSGPRGPKSLCNACGIRQRKARRALAAAQASENGTIFGGESAAMKAKVQNKEKKTNNSHLPFKKRCKFTAQARGRKKLCFEDLSSIILSKNSAFQQVFPQDEKEAAILLMALSYGLVHG